jgi:hypothetical protein
MLIGAKVARAAGAFHDREEADDPRSDANGSAKVALVGIDRSIEAWLRVRSHLPDEADELIDFLVELTRLRDGLEGALPLARAFVRPGFDEA